jgi:Na+-translocating membrane potential-generating system (MpsC)
VILREHYGRGPMKAKTYVLDDIIVVVMRGSGFTPLEQTIMDSGEPERVIAMREDFQRVMATIGARSRTTSTTAGTASTTTGERAQESLARIVRSACRGGAITRPKSNVTVIVREAAGR